MTFPPITSIDSPSSPSPTSSEPKCHRIDWLAGILDMPRQQIYNAISDGKIPSECVVRVGRRLRLKEAETLAWIANGGAV